ncbi:MAG: CobQ/CobB/MinD/ParA nucleotide binding domain protein [Methanosaeta sp. PtaU1.Bin112]|nr:MAG: CobQ/CobB/MinD/ParA nucleotide binding domain protein [Methanosaeta sp. PtaU1.Bin112]
MKISVASGKGGTGKTLVATSLAASRALCTSKSVTIADCDVEEPNSYLFFPDRSLLGRQQCLVSVPVFDEARCSHCGKCADFCAYHAIAVLPQAVLLFPELCHGCGGCGIICPEKAVSESTRSIGEIFRAASSNATGRVQIIWGELAVGEARATPLIKAVKDLAAGKNEMKGDSYEGGDIIVDCPPGTSCTMVESVRDTDFCLLVTEPTPFGLYDLDIALKVLAKMKIPSGVLVNKSGLGDRKVYDYLEKRSIPMLMEIPLDRKIAEIYSRGEIFALKMPDWQARFAGLMERIEEMAA